MKKINKYSLANIISWKSVSPEDRLKHSQMMIIALKKKVMERKKKKAIEDAIYWKSLD